MDKPLKTPYRVDNVPIYYWPVYYPTMWVLSIITRLVFLLIYSTARIEYKGEGLAALKKGAIECIWHETLPIYFAVNYRYRRPYAWMNHPLWYMKPVHLQLRWMGVRHLVLGSSGHSGKEALEQLVQWVATGDSTLVATDGPAGPVHEVKAGVLELSRRSGAPIVALRFSVDKFWIHQKSWDKKRWPLPFSRIVVEADAPIVVTDENRESVKEKITDFLNGK